MKYEDLITPKLLSKVFKKEVVECGLTYIFGGIRFRYSDEPKAREMNIYNFVYKYGLDYIKDRGYSLKIQIDIDKLYNKEDAKVAIYTRDGVCKFRSRESELKGTLECLDWVINKGEK